MSKSWGKSHGISPVLYLTPNSLLSKSFGSIMLAADRDEVDRTLSWNSRRGSDMLSSYIKPYEGDMWRGGKYVERVRFYDEREWRFVPDASRDGFRTALSKRDYQNEILRAQESTMVANVRLEFTPDDIKYIIVKKEAEILPMIRSIERIKGRFEPDTIKLLTTRIITVDQIREDF